MFTTRVQIRIILIGFFVLVVISSWVTFFGTRDHDRDHLALALTDHQKELALKLSWLVLVEPAHPEFENSIADFESTMRLLRGGSALAGHEGDAIMLHPEEDDQILDRLNLVSSAWVDYRDNLRGVIRSSAILSQGTQTDIDVQYRPDQLLTTLEDLRMTYNQKMEADLIVLRRTQVLLIIAAIPLLLWAVWIIHNRIVRPADFLAGAFKNIPLPEFSEQLPDRNFYADEVAELWLSFDEMRPKIEAASRTLELEVINQTQQLMNTFEASQEIVGQLELNTLLKFATQKAETLLQANSAAICLIEEGGDFLEIVSASGKIAARIGFDHELHNGNKIIRVGSIQDLENDSPCQKCVFFQACEQDSCLSTPLNVGAELIGSMCVVREPDRPFDSNDLRSLNLLGKATAVAIENARLSANVQRQTQQEIIHIERERLRTELHDSLGQTLSYLNLKVNRAKELVSGTEGNEILSQIEEIETATSTAYGQMRIALNELQVPFPDDDDTIYKGLIAFVDEFRRTTSLPVKMQVDKQLISELPRLVQQQALYIVREAFTNIHRHAYASHVKFTVGREGSRICFTIEDDGIGFDPDQIIDQTHLGVSIMRARAQRSGGQLLIFSAPGQGSRLKACFDSN